MNYSLKYLTGSTASRMAGNYCREMLQPQRRRFAQRHKHSFDIFISSANKESG